MFYLLFLPVLALMIWGIFLLFPNALIQLCFSILTKTVFRFQIQGLHNLPQKGGALLVANHVSLVEAFFLVAAVGRPIRFIMNIKYYERPWIKPFARLLKVIPISPHLPARDILKALQRAGKFLDQGELVCIFPEGQLNPMGMIQSFQRGVELMQQHQGTPIVPIYLDRVWGSVFSYEGGRYITKLPKHFPYQLTIALGTPLATSSSAGQMHQAVVRLGTETWIARCPKSLAIHHRFLQEARRNPFCTSLIDKHVSLSRIEVLAGAIALTRHLKSTWEEEENIGILLPTTLAAVLINLAVSIAGRVSVNLNFTTGIVQIHSAIQQANIKTIITSREFMEKVPIDLPEEMKIVYLEDVKPHITKNEKIKCLLAGLFLPCKRLETFCGAKRHSKGQDLLTLIFTSGSTGEPKGVMLSHFNVDTNVEAVAQVTPITGKHDRLLHTLPLFHSFGYMTMWLGLSSNIELILHPNPLDSQAIGELIHDYQAGIVFTTPTFLRTYMRKLTSKQLSTVKCVLTGAEKLSPNLADEFEQMFGIRAIEGYGVTECSPVIATNTIHVRLRGIFQPGTKMGTVGQPIPGVSARIVDPETFEELPQGWEGMLQVRGPNVMMGYLNEKELTQEVLKKGWYTTSDIASIDNEGYITITDRASRFSKIGGEMVPHGKVEEALHFAIGAKEQIFAVTAVQDKKKGEKLAVLYICDQQEIKPLLDKLARQGLPNLFIPHPKCFIKVDALPVLGNGKLDLKAIKMLAMSKLL